MENLLNTFNSTYKYLYDQETTENAAVIYMLENPYIDNFDDNLKTDPDFKNLVSKFNEYRQDIISSDREAAAFMIAYYIIEQRKQHEKLISML